MRPSTMTSEDIHGGTWTRISYLANYDRQCQMDKGGGSYARGEDDRWRTGSTTWQAMCWSGATTGTSALRLPVPRIPRGRRAALYRLLRGGSWIDAEDALRCSDRLGGDAEGQRQQRGFRVARTVIP